MFLVRPQAASGAGDDFWFQPVGGTSAAGASVTPVSALRLSVVYACVRVLSEAVAKLPIQMYQGEFDEANDLPLAKLLRRKPNPWQTSFEFREMMQAHLCLRSNAYAQIVFSGSKVAALVPCHPDRVDIEQTGEGRWRYKVRDWQGRGRVVLQDEMLHLKLLPMDGISGIATIAAQREAIGSALAAQDYAGRFLKNGAKHGGHWIEYPGKFADAEARKKFRDAFRAGMTGSDAFTTPVLDQGMKMHELGMTNADAQFIESRKYSDVDLCRMFLVPPHMVGILDRATNNNIEFQGRAFYNDTLMGLLRRWEESLEAGLLTEDEQDSGLRIEFDVDEITRADMKTRGETYSSGIQAGWLTPNEARRRERLKPIDGLDEPLSPLNMTPAGQRGADAPPAPAPAPAPDTNQAARERMLFEAAADRAATREVNGIAKIVERHATGRPALEAVADFYATHADWMARAMAIEPACAAKLCEARFDEIRTHDVSSTLERWTAGGGRLLLASAEPEWIKPRSAEDLRHEQTVGLLSKIEEQMRIPTVVNVPAPVVQVAVPEQAAPVVNVAAPTVNVAAPNVKVEPRVQVDAKVVAEESAPDGMPWTKQTTVDKTDAKGRPTVYTTRPVRR